MSLADKIILGVLAVGTLVGGLKLHEYGLKIEEQEARRAGQIVQYDVNKDGLVDFVDGNGLIRLQQKDGTYFTVDEVKAQETRALQDSIKALDSKYEVRQEKVRNSVDNLDYKVNRYVVGGN